MAKSFKPSEVFPPRNSLAKSWPLQVVNQIINGKKRITVETAKEIGLAFGTPIEPDKAIARRAREMAV